MEGEVWRERGRGRGMEGRRETGLEGEGWRAGGREG